MIKNKCCKEFKDSCSLKLAEYPTSPCPLAVQRLKLLAGADKNVSYLQETKAGGCDWYVFNGEANYCFFKYMAESGDKEHTTIDIAELLFITQASVYSSLNRAFNKLKEIADLKRFFKKSK